jgi:uridine phosphorylase
MVFPNFSDKYREASLFSPKDYVNYLRKREQYPKFTPPTGVILCYSRSLLEYTVKHYKVRRAEGFSGGFYLFDEAKGNIGIIGNFGFGAPIVSTIMEELIALGVKRFLSIGVAGSLQKHLTVGSIVVCDRAIRDEGVSHHYLKPSKYAYASKSMVKKIEETLKKFGLESVVGTSWTIDAPYRETVAEIKKYQEEGVLTVEMEASAIFSVAKYRNVESGAMFTISDYLAELEWKPKFHLTAKYMEKLFQVAKEVLKTS